MLDEVALSALIARLRNLGEDTHSIEVKASADKLPKSVAETLSAFANGDGGILILGLDERAGFVPAKGFGAQRIADAVAGTCADRLQPPLKARIETLPFEGQNVVVVTVDALRPTDKPCFIKERGMYQGSFVRTGDGDRHLSAYEVDRLREEHRQPKWDEEMVDEATQSDLDDVMLDALIARQRTLRPVLFRQGGRDEALQRLRVLRATTGGTLRPTLAGLLALGSFPQEFFPRLTVTFAAYPGPSKATVLHGRERLLDNRTLAGPIPLLVRDTVSLVAKNMRLGAVVEGAFRSDVPDYPLPAVREAVTNALMHRDYSELSRGTQVQVNMYVDRLEIMNPGGLYGTVTLASLGKPGVSSARNQRLSALLEDVAYPDGGMVAENRGSGYATIEAEMQRALMPPPVPRDDLAGFTLTLPRRALTPDEQGANLRTSTRAAILAAVDQQGSVSSSEVMRASGLSRTAVVRQLNALVDEGLLTPTEPGRSPKQRYRRTHDPLFD